MTADPTPPVTPNLAESALLNYQQADEDGVMVLVSRQAIHETLDALADARAEVSRLTGALAAETERAESAEGRMRRRVEQVEAAQHRAGERHASERRNWHARDEAICEQRDAYEARATAAEAALAAREGEVARLRNDCSILLASLDHLAQCTGEGPEDEDRVLVEQIRADLAKEAPDAEKVGARDA